MMAFLRACLLACWADHHNHYWEKGQKLNTEGKIGSWKRQWARRCIDAGASLYVAHGDPRMQGIEIYKVWQLLLDSSCTPRLRASLLA